MRYVIAVIGVAVTLCAGAYALPTGGGTGGGGNSPGGSTPPLQYWIGQSHASWGDFDNDGDVDAADFLIFQGCFNGPNRPPGKGDADADWDRDGDVDGLDFLAFQGVFNGPNRPPNLAGPRPGDVGGAGENPEPLSLTLVASGIAALAITRRRPTNRVRQ
jgi:hypothetical protein